jgi:hypothetical protein
MERNKTISGQTLEAEKGRKRPAGMGCVPFNPSRERLGYEMDCQRLGNEMNRERSGFHSPGL